MSRMIQGAAIGIAAGAALLATLARARASADGGASESAAHLDAARSFNRSSALLALSVLADSGIEHYRGSFANRAMYAPLATSLLSLGAGLHGGADGASRRHPARHAIYLTAGAVGVAGTGFHLYNVTKRPGGMSWHNFFYAAPIGAPMALLLARTGATVTGMRVCPRCRKRGASGSQRWTTKAARASACRSRVSKRHRRLRSCRRWSAANWKAPRGAACRRNCSSRNASCTTYAALTIRIRTPGARSALAGRRIRGYVRMGFDRRDPWEAVEQHVHDLETPHAR